MTVKPLRKKFEAPLTRLTLMVHFFLDSLSVIDTGEVSIPKGFYSTSRLSWIHIKRVSIK